jgi:hypothetical protein
MLSALQALLPANRKQTPSGWMSFDAPCCHHRGESQDDRKRGGVMITGDAFTYHCFNCGFKAGWSPGKTLSANTRKLFSWMGLPESEVSRLAMEALREHDAIPKEKKQYSFELDEVDLPEATLTVTEWLNTDYLPDIADDLGKIVEYILNRGMELEWYNWMWSPATGYVDRVIIPFYQDQKIVGYTARKITEGKPKYLAHGQPGYVFNLTNQPRERKYVIVVEGQFDAIAVDGVCIGHNDPNETQIARINTLGKEVIVVPDRDKPGAKMLKSAIENHWSASLPPWGDDIKDLADAVKRYGRLYVLATILHYKTANQLKIQVMKKKLEGITDD